MANTRLNDKLASTLGVDLSVLADRLGKEPGQMVDSAEASKAADELKASNSSDDAAVGPPADDASSSVVSESSEDDETDEEVTPDSAAEDPAHAEFFDWWATIQFVKRPFDVLGERVAHRDKALLIRYRTGDGGERETKKDDPKFRLLSKEREDEGVSILAKFRKAPHNSLTCAECKTGSIPLTEERIKRLLVSTLEDILYGTYSTQMEDGGWETDLDAVTFSDEFPKEFRHPECQEFQEKFESQRKVNLTAEIQRFRLENRRPATEEETALLKKKIYQAWKPEADKLLEEMRAKDIPTRKFERKLERVL